MLNTKKVGATIAFLRKNCGYSQEKLADLLSISPQAISKWENGHTLPETSLLPELAQIFGCSIDEILMSGYSAEEQKGMPIHAQAKQIAEQVIKEIGDRLASSEGYTLSSDAIVEAIFRANGNVGVCRVERKDAGKIGQNTVTRIQVSGKEKKFNLIEKRYNENDTEIRSYSLLCRWIKSIPQVYLIDSDKKIVLTEDIGDSYVNGFNYDEHNEDGVFFRENYHTILRAIAKWHIVFWEKEYAFAKIGLDWRLDSKENLLAHIGMMQKDFERYREREISGKIPKVWQSMENHIDMDRLDYFGQAIQILKEEYTRLLDQRFYTGKNITVIHGDMNPGTINISRADKQIKFEGLQAVRMGIGTEDLAMLIALHIEPDKEKAMPLLDYYYSVLCESIKDYPYETFMDDYKLSVMESMFFVLKLMNNGIYDFVMRDKAMKAFETFILQQ